MADKEMLARAREIYRRQEFRDFMRKLQGASDDDFKKPVPVIQRKILGAPEKDPLAMFFPYL